MHLGSGMHDIFFGNAGKLREHRPARRADTIFTVLVSSVDGLNREEVRVAIVWDQRM